MVLNVYVIDIVIRTVIDNYNQNSEVLSTLEILHTPVRPTSNLVILRSTVVLKKNRQKEGSENPHEAVITSKPTL